MTVDKVIKRLRAFTELSYVPLSRSVPVARMEKPRDLAAINNGSPVFKLLPELRELILSLLLVRSRTNFSYSNAFPLESRNRFFRTFISICLVCKRLRREARVIFFGQNHFNVYSVTGSYMPSGWRIDNQWFTKYPVLIRRMTLLGWDTPKLVASCPNLKELIVGEKASLSHIYNAAHSEVREAWMLQYRTNLARLLSKKGGIIRFEGNGTFCEKAELLGSGELVDTWEVNELLENIRDRCGGVALLTKWKARHDEEEVVDSWIVRFGYSVGGIVTAKLVRRVEDVDTQS